MRNLLLSVAACVAAALASPAIATPITYTLAVHLHATLDGNPFDGQFYQPVLFTGVGDTNDLFDQDGIPFIPLSQLTMVSDGTTYHVITPSWFATNAEYGIGGFVFGDTSAEQALTGMDYPDYPTFTGRSPADPFIHSLVGNFWAAGTLVTDHGTLVIEDAEDYVFSATLTAEAPEPAAWAMMVVGFGIIGAGMRRSRVPALS